MAKKVNTNETHSEPQAKTETVAVLSVDTQNGIVVLETSAEAGTELIISVNGERHTAKVADGQAWFYTGSALPDPNFVDVL